MGQVVGPFTVEDANLLAVAQAAASAIPAAIQGADTPGASHLWSSKRFGAPSWAYGYTPNGTNTFLNPARHAVVHEYAHAWWYRHGRQVGGDAALRALVDHPELLGKVESSHTTNRLSEAYAHAFAAACGYPDGVRESFFQVKIPPANYGALLDLMSKALGEATRPTHRYLLSGRVALRSLPQLQAPAVAWAAAGSVIRAVTGRSGDPYRVQTADGAGLPSVLWLQVDALDGRLLSPPLWSAALLWVPLPALPSPS